MITYLLHQTFSLVVCCRCLWPRLLEWWGRPQWGRVSTSLYHSSTMPNPPRGHSGDGYRTQQDSGLQIPSTLVPKRRIGLVEKSFRVAISGGQECHSFTTISSYKLPFNDDIRYVNSFTYSISFIMSTKCLKRLPGSRSLYIEEISTDNLEQLGKHTNTEIAKLEDLLLEIPGDKNEPSLPAADVEVTVVNSRRCSKAKLQLKNLPPTLKCARTANN